MNQKGKTCFYSSLYFFNIFTIFKLLDIPDREHDLRLAQHVTYVHKHREHPPTDHAPLSISTMRRYLELCRDKNPTVPAGLTEFIVNAYVELRKEAREFTSARTLLSGKKNDENVSEIYFEQKVEKFF